MPTRRSAVSNGARNRLCSKSSANSMFGRWATIAAVSESGRIRPADQADH